MAQLLYSAKGPDGKPIQGFVEAGGVREARDKLAVAGLTDIVLHQEVAIAQDEALTAGLDAAALAQLAQFQLRVRAAPGLNTVLAEVARRNRVWLVIGGLLLAYGFWSAREWTIVMALGLLVSPFALAAWSYRHAGRYDELIKAFAVGEWSRVEDLAAKLRDSGPKTPELGFDLDVRIASIRARKGDLPGALRDLETWREKLAASPGFFDTRLASVHAAAGDRDGFVRLMGQAYEASRREPSRALDYALAHARYGDAAQAAALLGDIDASLLPPHGKGFLLWTRALVTLRQGGGLEALDLFGQATREFLQLAGNPAAWTALAFCACDHAVALGGAGRKDEARRLLAQVWPIVSAHADKPLLRLLRADGLAPA